jgi:hypothetical protein
MDVQVLINVYTISGRLLKTVKRTINTGVNRSSDIEWDLKSDSGSPILSGTYIYQLRITSNQGTTAEKSGKMVVL